MSKYLAIISRDNFSTFFKYGEINFSDFQFRKIQKNITSKKIADLLEKVSPWELSSEYIFLLFNCEKEAIKKTGMTTFFFENLEKIIPIDIFARKEFEIMYEIIQFASPEDNITQECFKKQADFQKNNMKKGVSDLFSLSGLKKDSEIFKSEVYLNILAVLESPQAVNSKDSKKTEQKDLFDKNSIEEKEIYDFDLESRAFIYQRHEPYPRNFKGLVYDMLEIISSYLTCQRRHNIRKTSLYQGFDNKLISSLEEYQFLLEKAKNKTFQKKCKEKKEQHPLHIDISIAVLILLDLQQNFKTVKGLSSLPDWNKKVNLYFLKYEEETTWALFLLGAKLGHLRLLKYTLIYRNTPLKTIKASFQRKK